MDKPGGESMPSREVAECSSAEVAEALTRSFEGYLTGPVKIGARAYERRFRGEDLDPFASRVYYRDDSASAQPVGVVLVSRRGWTSRIAGMGVVPEFRGQGLGEQAVREAIQEARARDDRAMVLEVFEQNEPAVRLYEKLGFRTLRRLFGYHREPDREIAAEASGALAESDPLEVARIVAREGETDLPWMLAAETLSSATPSARAYRLEHQAYALVEELGTDTLLLFTLVVRRQERGKGKGAQLIRELSAAFPGRGWSIPPIVPENMAKAFLTRHGWERARLNQLEMYLSLAMRPERDTGERESEG